MKYNIGELVIVNDNVKNICDLECIDKYIIYYMSDKTSYEENEITSVITDDGSINKIAKNHIINFYSKKLTEGFNKIHEEYLENKQIEKSKNTNKNLFFKLKEVANHKLFFIFGLNPKPSINKS